MLAVSGEEEEVQVDAHGHPVQTECLDQYQHDTVSLVYPYMTSIPR